MDGIMILIPDSIADILCITNKWLDPDSYPGNANCQIFCYFKKFGFKNTFLKMFFQFPFFQLMDEMCNFIKKLLRLVH